MTLFVLAIIGRPTGTKHDVNMCASWRFLYDYYGKISALDVRTHRALQMLTDSSDVTSPRLPTSSSWTYVNLLSAIAMTLGRGFGRVDLSSDWKGQSLAGLGQPQTDWLGRSQTWMNSFVLRLLEQTAFNWIELVVRWAWIGINSHECLIERWIRMNLDGLVWTWFV